MGAPRERVPRRGDPPGEPDATVVVYSRPGCHLCEEAIDALVVLARGGPRFELVEIDIESDEALHAAMLERIPVVEIGGEVVSELRLDEAAVRARLDTLLA